MWLNNQNKRIFVNSANIQVAVFIRRENFIRFMKIVYCLLKKVPSLYGRENKMIVISDGDVIKNQLDKDGQPLELGYDKWTNKLYANKGIHDKLCELSWMITTVTSATRKLI
jgi:hypothetical protein